jgi:FAD/FMN-containing dehydrogenase
MDHGLGGSLSAFEALWHDFYRLVTSPPAKGRPPVQQDYPYYVLLESQGASRELDEARFQNALEGAFEAGLIADAAVAQSEADCQAFWALRDDVEQTMHGGAPVIFDVSLPVAAMEAYTMALPAALEAAIGEHRLFIFGHLGDGNLHVIVQVAPEAYERLRPKVEQVVYEPLEAVGGSVSAEHGIGLEKKPWLSLSRSPVELALMRRLKEALDPRGILNPGKIL